MMHKIIFTVKNSTSAKWHTGKLYSVYSCTDWCKLKWITLFHTKKSNINCVSCHCLLKCYDLNQYYNKIVILQITINTQFFSYSCITHVTLFLIIFSWYSIHVHVYAFIPFTSDFMMHIKMNGIFYTSEKHRLEHM